MQCPYCGGEMSFLLPQHVAQLLDVPLQTVRRWIREGRFPGAEKIDVRGRMVWRVPTSAVVKILEGK